MVSWGEAGTVTELTHRAREMTEIEEQAERLQQAVKGDEEALQQLIVQCHGPLYGVLEGRMGSTLRRHVDPDDVLQEAYVAAFKSITRCSFDGPGGFYKWLERIALDRLKDIQRGLKRKKRDIGRRHTGPGVAASSYPDLLERLTAAQSTPSRHLAKREASAAVLSSLARLTDDQREVVRMRIMEGKQAADVAAELGKPEAAVHMLCHRGLKALRVMLVSITRYLTTR